MKTTTEAAALLGVSKRRVQQLVLRGQLKAVKIGRDWLIKEESLKKFERRGPGRPRSSEPIGNA